MKYALIIVEDKNSVTKGSQGLRSLANSLLTSEPRKGQDLAKEIEFVNVGAYIVRLECGLHALSHIVSQAESYGLSLRTLFFEDEPPWVITPYKGEAI